MPKLNSRLQMPSPYVVLQNDEAHYNRDLALAVSFTSHMERKIQFHHMTPEEADLQFEVRACYMEFNESPIFTVQWYVISPLAISPLPRTAHGGHLTLNRSPHGNKTAREQFVPIAAQPYSVTIGFPEYKVTAYDLRRLNAFPTIVSVTLTSH